MSGAVVFTTDPDDGELAVGVVALHHRPEGESALTVVPITALAGLPAAADWWPLLGVAGPDALPVLPPPSAADDRRSGLAGERAMKEHWDPRARGVEQAARPGWFFTGRRQALSQLAAIPARDQAVAVIMARLLKLPCRSVVLAEDETHLHLSCRSGRITRIR